MDDEKRIRRLAGRLQSFLNGIEGRKLYQYLRDEKDIFLVAAAPLEKEGILKSYCLSGDGLLEFSTLRGSASDTYEQRKELMKHSIKGKRLTAREFLQGIAGLPESEPFDLEDIVEQFVHYRAKKEAGTIVPLSPSLFAPNTETPRD